MYVDAGLGRSDSTDVVPVIKLFVLDKRLLAIFLVMHQRRLMVGRNSCSWRVGPRVCVCLTTSQLPHLSESKSCASVCPLYIPSYVRSSRSMPLNTYQPLCSRRSHVRPHAMVHFSHNQLFVVTLGWRSLLSSCT